MRNYYILFLLSLLGLDAMAQQGYNEMATPKRLGAFINTSAEESLPLLSADGKDLYFFRTFEEYNFGGVNDQDIWLCSKNEKGNWELGLKYRFAGGAPFTPFDETASRLNYLSTGTGVLNFSQLNSQRLASFNQLDIRVDKKYNFKRVTLDLFLDIQNVIPFAAPAFPRYAFKRTDDNSGFATTDGRAIQADGSNAVPIILPNDPSRPLPTIGFILEF